VAGRAEFCAQCWFLDVGQGSSQVILLGGGRAIVLDGGPSSSVPLAFLKGRGVKTLAALIVSHNDSDHDKGASDILTAYQESIQDLFFLEDRPHEQIRIYSLAHRLNNRRRAEGRAPIRMSCLAQGGGKSSLVDEPRKRLRLSVLFPDYEANLRARSHKKSPTNQTCAILLLECGSRKVVFSGDAPIAAWRWMIANHLMVPPLACDIFVVPHHGGIIWERGSDDTELRDELRWLYTEALRCEHAILSVGTTNTFGHPKPVGVESLRDVARSKILCTQITQQCCEEPERLGQGVIAPDVFSRSHSSRGRRGQVACAGTVIVDIGQERVTIQRLAEHQAAVDHLKKTPGGHPLCRS
jgi:beta-lactamase superfamily II metal-dependent hydrolase